MAVDCDRCAGNGEIVTDWARYLAPLPGDVGDEAVAPCPTCDGAENQKERDNEKP